MRVRVERGAGQGRGGYTRRGALPRPPHSVTHGGGWRVLHGLELADALKVRGKSGRPRRRRELAKAGRKQTSRLLLVLEVLEGHAAASAAEARVGEGHVHAHAGLGHVLGLEQGVIAKWALHLVTRGEEERRGGERGANTRALSSSTSVRSRLLRGRKANTESQ